MRCLYVWLLLLLLLPLAAEAQVEVRVEALVSPALLRLDDGQLVRLAGIEVALPEHAGARRAAERALEGLLDGQSLVLHPEEPGSDRLGRDLVQAFRREDGLWLQGQLLRWGHARVDPFTAPFDKLAALYALEAEAREEGLGLWSHPAYRLRSILSQELLPWEGSLQVIEGEVAAVGEGGGNIYLNFGEDWKSDTTARVLRRDRRRFENAGIDLSALTGRNVRLRGRIQSWNGPFLELHNPAQIEVLEHLQPDGTED